MSPMVRKLLFDPLVSGDLSLIVPDLLIDAGVETITAPARLSRKHGDQFAFDLHFESPEIPESVRKDYARALGLQDRLLIFGRIEGQIPFATRVFPPSSWSSRGFGTSNATVFADRLDLLQETDHARLLNEARALAGSESLCVEPLADAFRAHLIFHGPQLQIVDSRTSVTTSHDFLGETTNITFDTHVFRGDGWEAALIQKADELHLHVRPLSGAAFSAADSLDLVNRVRDAVAFTHGFHPWPIYQELRAAHRVFRRELSAKLNLKQTSLAPVSEALQIRLLAGQQSGLGNIIPTIADGFVRLTEEQRDRLGTLLWNVRACDLGDLPRSTKLLILCAAFDGLMKVIGGDMGKARTRDEWEAAASRLRVKWEDWMEPVMRIRKRHRDDLSHGRLWIPEDTDADQLFKDYPRLGGAFMTVIATACGYDGPIMADRLASRAVNISDRKA